MSPALDSSLAIVAYLALFAAVGVLFLFASLLIGWFLRPSNPHAEKREIYECGEPAIGTSFVQFDLRFYVVALLFIVFDVEIAFFFPWAVVFGKTARMMDQRFDAVAVGPAGLELTPNAEALYAELGVGDRLADRNRAALAGRESEGEAERVIRDGAWQLALLTVVDIVVFFAVLLVGFAYVWKRGDLDWVRAVVRGGAETPGRLAGAEPAEQETAIPA